MKIMAAEHEDSFGGRARESVTGWWGRSRRSLAEVRNELSRVTWPSRKEVAGSTSVVIVMVVVVAAFLAVVDHALTWLVRVLLR